MTGNDIINSSLRLIGATGTGEVPDADESADALSTLNDMLESWSIDRLSVFTVNRLGPFSLTPGQQAYTMGGPTGPFQLSATRPVKVQGYGVILLSNPLQPLELPIEAVDEYGWAAIPVKNIQSALPLKVWDDGAFPARVLSFYPIPNVPVQLVVYAWGQLTAFPDLVTNVSFPPGYAKAIRYNLAIDLAPEYGMSVPPEVIAVAMESKAKLEAINAPILTLRCDSGVTGDGGHYNWNDDSIVGGR